MNTYHLRQCRWNEEGRKLDYAWKGGEGLRLEMIALLVVRGVYERGQAPLPLLPFLAGFQDHGTLGHVNEMEGSREGWMRLRGGGSLSSPSHA